MASPLVRWLAGLTVEQLAAILTRRPEVRSGPAPDTLGVLAARLQARDSVAAALDALPRPAIQLIEVIQTLGGPTVAHERVAEAIGRAPDDPELEATLSVLAGRALVWPSGDGLRMAGPLWSAFAHPLGLGSRAEVLFNGMSGGELRGIAHALGLAPGPTRQELLATVLAALADGARVRAVVAAAPPDARRLLTDLAHNGPRLRALTDEPALPTGHPRTGRASAAIDWAVDRGLLVWGDWQQAELPAEVGMALRGPDWRAPFDPLPPRLELVDVDPAAVTREAAAAALTAVEQVTALLDTIAATPVTLLKAGGVGSRELRRLARSVGCGEPEVRLWLELAYAAGLIGIASEQVRPTESYDEWGASEPAGRLAALLRAWTRLPAAPLVEQRRDGGTPVPALLRDATMLAAGELRTALLRCAADLPDGQAVAEGAGLERTLHWRLPVLAGLNLDGSSALPAALCREARLLGAIAHGALTAIGRALLEDPATLSGSLSSVAEKLLPSAVGAAVFQNDLTVVVPGIPTGTLATLLDESADRESGGGASTWRFSTNSVRAALDAGIDPGGLVADLRAVAVGGVLPQVLEYLIADTARRHGRIRVRAVACVLRADDPALVAEIARARALRPLALTALAPTVLASAKPLGETLRALRAAGYAPVGEDGDGEPRIERAPRRRAPALRGPGRGSGWQRPSGLDADAGSGGGRRREQVGADPVELAGRLLAGAALEAPPEPGTPPEPKTPPEPETPSERKTRSEPETPSEPELAQVIALPVRAGHRVTPAIREYCGHLDVEQQEILAVAIARGVPVKIDYRNAAGNYSSRVIEPIDLDEYLLTAWCHLRDEERMFALDRIQNVSPC